MSVHHISVSGTLAKQRSAILEKFTYGLIRSVEQRVLDAVLFSPGTEGRGKVELHEPLGSFRVSFELGKYEKMTKIVETTKAANDYLLEMMESFKSGSLTQRMRANKAEVKPAVALTKAADDLQQKSSGKDGLDDFVPLLSGEGSATDVTADFLNIAKEQVVEKLAASIAIHRNSLNSFIQVASKSPNVFGVMLGKEAWNKKFHSVSIILATTCISDVLKNERVQGRCQSMGLSPCGAIVVGPENHWMSRFSEVAGHFNGVANPLMICVDFSNKICGDVSAVEMNDEVGGQVAVSPSWTTNPRDVQLRFNYTMTFLDDFGISHVEDATKRICSAIMSHVLERDHALYRRRGSSKTVSYKKLPMPADGWCGFHSIIAGNNLEQYLSVPRKDNGDAKQNHMISLESRTVKQFHRDVCQKALDRFPMLRDQIENVKSNPAFSPADLSWISEVCGITVRVTCSPEARVCKETCISYSLFLLAEHTHIYVYMCMQLYLLYM